MKPRIVVIGSLNQDLVLRVATLPQPGQTILATQFDVYPGGKGANQAVAAARFGAAVTLVGRVGRDPAGSLLRASLTSNGVDLQAVHESSSNTGTAVIATDLAGGNMIIVSAGANSLLSVADVQEHEALITGSSIVLLQLEVPLETVSYAASLCRRHGVPVMLDPAPAQPLPPEILRSITWLTPNESEAAALCPEVNGMSDDELLLHMLACGPGNVVLKQGARGCSLRGLDAAPARIAPFRVTPADTTAAGDTFNGAFACALAEGKPPHEAARLANAAAALSITRPGAQPSMPTRDEVETWLGNFR